MSFHINPPAAARPAAPRDSAGTASPQQPQPRSTAGTSSRLGWLYCLPIRNRNVPALPQPAPQGPLGQLPPELLHEVVVRTAGAGRPQDVARQLAVLRPVNKAFRDAADKEPAIRRAASEQRLAHATNVATREWINLQKKPIRWKFAKENEYSIAAARITERLAATVRNLDQVIVDRSRLIDPMAQTLLDALPGHPKTPALEVVAKEGWLLNRMTELLEARPELLHSLYVRTGEGGESWVNDEARSSQAKLSRVLAKQTNLATLKLQDADEGRSGRRPQGLDHAGLSQAIASLSGLKSFTLSGYSYGGRDDPQQNEVTALANVLRKLPELKELDLHNNLWDTAAFVRFASSLPALPGLQRLDLGRRNVSMTLLHPRSLIYCAGLSVLD